MSYSHTGLIGCERVGQLAPLRVDRMQCYHALVILCCVVLVCNQVLVVITRWRTEANEERERQGLGKVYLLEHKAAEQEALRAAPAAAGGTEGLTGRTGRELRKMRATA